MKHPKVSILMLTHDAPEEVATTLDGIATTLITRYELIVVDNASGPETRAVLEDHRDMIDKLVLSDENLLFAAGNNRAFEESDPEAKYVLLLNSDVEINSPLWLAVLVEWAEWLPQTYVPGHAYNPADPKPGPRDIVSFGWCPRPTRPDGWCCLIRRDLYAKYRMNAEEYPWYYGLGDLVARAMHDGARAGVLANMVRYIHHLASRSPRPEGLRGTSPEQTAAQQEWYRDLDVETLTFSLEWLSDDVIRRVQKLIEEGLEDNEIADRLGIVTTAVRFIRAGRPDVGPALVRGSTIGY